MTCVGCLGGTGHAQRHRIFGKGRSVRRAGEIDQRRDSQKRYSDIADWILPHVSGRILSLVRCPSGASEKCFFAKHAWQGLSDAVQGVDVGEKEQMLALNNLEGLIDLVQASVLEIHPWGSTVDNLERPDRLIFDLDPGVACRGTR